MDSSAASIHHFNLLQIHFLALQPLYSKNTTSIATRCSLQVRKAHTISIPTLITPDVWLMTSAPSTVITGMTIVCLEGPTKLITLWKPHPYLTSTTSLQCYITIF